MWQFLWFTLHARRPLNFGYLVATPVCQNKVRDKADASVSLSHAHLLLVNLTCLSGPCSSLIFCKTLPSFPTWNHSPACLLFPFYSTSHILPCFKFFWGWSPLVEKELGDGCWSLMLLPPPPSASIALHMHLLHGRCPINIYQVEITQIWISG